MQLDELSKEEILNLEIPTGAPIKYIFDEHGKVEEKLNLFE